MHSVYTFLQNGSCLKEACVVNICRLPDSVRVVVVGGAQRVGAVLDLHGTSVRFLHGHLELVVLALQLLRLSERARDRERRRQHCLAVADPTHHLSGILLELT